MDKAIKRAGKEPKIVITDKLKSYLDVRYGKDSEHKQGSPFSFKTTGESTAQIERFHGTIKDRTKVMRAFRNFETLNQFMDGYLIYYNFFKPNEAINNKTPAEAAKVDYAVKNWKDLCQAASEKQSQPRIKVVKVELRGRVYNLNHGMRIPNSRITNIRNR